MADLTIAGLSSLGVAKRAPVRATLIDPATGLEVTGTLADGDGDPVIVREASTYLDDAGEATLDLAVTEEITPANTAWRIVIGDKTFEIVKADTAETLHEALLATPDDLPGVAQVDTTGITDGQGLVFDESEGPAGRLVPADLATEASVEAAQDDATQALADAATAQAAAAGKVAKAGDTMSGMLKVTETTGEARVTESGHAVLVTAGDANAAALIGRYLGASGMAFGAGGASPMDVAIVRTAAGVMSMSAGKFRPGTPVASGDAADKSYVDAVGDEVEEQRTYIDAQATAAVAPFMRKLMRNAEDVNLVICSDSTGDADDNFEWPYQLAEHLAAEFPTHTVKRARLTAGPVWGGQNTIQTGTGARTLNVWVASHAGRRFDFFVGENKPLITDKTPDLLVVSHGHNEGDPGSNGATENTPEQFASRFVACAETFLLDLPLCPILVVLQNPRADNTHQEKRMQAIQRAAALRGYGVVDVLQAFLDTGDVASLLVDNLHPNEAGHDLWAATLAPAFTRSVAVTGAGGLNRSIFADPVAPAAQLAINSNFATWTNTATAPDSWTILNSATVARSNEQTDSDGFSCKISNNAASSGGIRNVFMSAAQVLPFRGQWVTVAARLWIPDGSDDDTAGVCRIYDGVNQTWSLARHGPHDGWFWRTVTHKVTSTATLLRVEILADYSNTTGTVYVDRCCVVPGIVPRDVLRRALSGS